MNEKILIAEDDIHISGLLSELLRRNNYESRAAFSGTEALLILQNEKFSLILLDLMLPGKSGTEVLAEIRGILNINTPVIALTAVADKDSVVNLLKSGANDYITKPFDNMELLARIEVQLRANNPELSKAITFRELTLDCEMFDAFFGNMENQNALKLSKREFEILRLLMENPKKVFTKNNLYESVWNDEFLGDDNTINVHISKIRAKIAHFTPDDYIQTVWGIGFKMRE